MVCIQLHKKIKTWVFKTILPSLHRVVVIISTFMLAVPIYLAVDVHYVVVLI